MAYTPISTVVTPHDSFRAGMVEFDQKHSAERSEQRILRRSKVEARTGLARSTIYERMKAGTFPTSVSLGAKAVGWIESEIDAWINAQIASSRKA